MDSDLMSAVIRNRQAMSSMPTQYEPKCPKLPDIRTVIFDVYGTLVISGSGDVGSVNEQDKGTHIANAIRTAGLTASADQLPSIDLLQQQIRDANAKRKSEACPKPEVDIVAVWRGVLETCGIPVTHSGQVVRLAAEYESLANPTWPMPGSAELISALRDQGRPLGIVSNAQIFTIPLVTDISGGPLGSSGFDLNLCVFSNRFRQAKPGPRLFEVLCQALARSGISPEQAIYVGNDMLNDVWAASQAGLKTAWFAGDQRSCRPRSDDPRCKDLVPNLVLTDLMQLPDCLPI